MKDTVRLDSEEKARFIADKAAQSSASHGTGRHDTVPDGVTQDSAKHDTAQQDRVADDSARGAALRQQRPCSPATQPCPASAAAPRMTALRMTASLKAAFRRQRPCSPATCSCLTESRGGETLEHDAFPEFPPCGQLLFRPGEVRQLLCLCAALMRGRLKIT